MRWKGYILIGFVCFFYWILDSVWSHLSFEVNLKNLIFREPASYLDTFLLRVTPYQMVSRLMVVVLFAVIGVLIIEFMNRRQAAEKERKEAHDTFLTILNSIDATIYVADMENYEILFMNQRMIESFGGDLSGQICYRAFRNGDNICNHCPNAQLLDESGSPRGVVIWEGMNPVTNAWYANYDRAIKWVDGRIVHIQIAADISRLKELQEKQARVDEQLRQAQKMDSIGNLAGGIAHDFNNILSSIIGFTELALEDVGKGSAVEDYLQEVYTAGKRAKDLVGQILAFARQSGEEVKPIQVDVIVKEVLKFIRSSIPTTIAISSNIDSNSLISGNSTQVHQIMMNLCTNAAHAMEDDGGELTVSLKDIVVDKDIARKKLGLPYGNYLEISVSDTGRGMSQGILDSIFEPYFTTKGPGEGTGMGLAMVHGIVESYGGKIVVHSTLGNGSTFTIYLPVMRKRSLESQYQSEQLPAGTERILYVDDEAPLVKMGSQVLESLGYTVTTRTNSVEALELFRAGPGDFDLVITDMTMPGLTGEKLDAELMAIRADIPVILCTGYSKKITDETALQMGIKAFAHKPIVKADLAKTVRMVLDDGKIIHLQ